MNNKIIAVVGLGYVGLPLALEFGKQYQTIGYDISEEKIKSLKEFIDPNGEIDQMEMMASSYLKVTNDAFEISEADIIIVAIPTPVDNHRRPDLSLLINASSTVAKYIKKGAIVVFESTVYPGATEDVCIPVIEKISKKKWKEDFNVGYSPERINPGDKVNTITKITKVVSGDIPETLEILSDLYGSIIDAGVFKASSIKVAEASKVIENTQRDLNIALINELSIIFDKIGINTHDVLASAETKWNFIKYTPGLVGGHCIGVDPYYLTFKAESLGYHPEVILAGRRINDGMAEYVAKKIIKKMISQDMTVKKAKAIIMGLSFKENCSDIRNSKVVDLINELKDYGFEINVHDPVVNPIDSKNEYQINLREWDDLPICNVIVIAVPHKSYIEFGLKEIVKKLSPGGLLIDLKSAFRDEHVNLKGIEVWSL
jgi:UDP-N-acetyl-D-glucosamine/UDP-N-acetyl-D-galactosamine dehydrogenase